MNYNKIWQALNISVNFSSDISNNSHSKSIVINKPIFVTEPFKSLVSISVRTIPHGCLWYMPEMRFKIIIVWYFVNIESDSLKSGDIIILSYIIWWNFENKRLFIWKRIEFYEFKKNERKSKPIRDGEKQCLRAFVTKMSQPGAAGLT